MASRCSPSQGHWISGWVLCLQETNHIISPATAAAWPIMDSPCQLSLAVLAGRWANGPPLALMPFSLAVTAAAADLHGNSSDLAVWKKQVTTGPTPGDLRHAHWWADQHREEGIGQTKPCSLCGQCSLWPQTHLQQLRLSRRVVSQRPFLCQPRTVISKAGTNRDVL